MKLDPFYLIVDSAEWISKLVPLGVKLVQLRIKDQTVDGLRSEIRKAKLVCAQHDCQLVVNDYWQLAIEEGCSFVHLGQEDLADADLKAIKEAGIALGVSTHDEKELEEAVLVKPHYIALGPIFRTTLKQMKWQPQGLEKISNWKKKIGHVPLVAIGGITRERVPSVFEHGADSAAVVTDVLGNSSPEARVKEWLSLPK